MARHLHLPYKPSSPMAGAHSCLSPYPSRAWCFCDLKVHVKAHLHKRCLALLWRSNHATHRGYPSSNESSWQRQRWVNVLPGVRDRISPPSNRADPSARARECHWPNDMCAGSGSRAHPAQTGTPRHSTHANPPANPGRLRQAASVAKVVAGFPRTRPTPAGT